MQGTIGIPASILALEEVRSEENVVLKSVKVSKLSNIPLKRVCRYFNANYDQARRARIAIANGRDPQQNGRPPLVPKKFGEIEQLKILSRVESGNPVTYSELGEDLQTYYNKGHLPLDPLAPFPTNLLLRPHYAYEAVKRLELSSKDIVVLEQRRQLHGTTGNIAAWFKNTYTEKLLEGVPPELIWNCDEIHAELGIPKKAFGPQNAFKMAQINYSGNSAHITSLVSLNPLGDDFLPYIIVPLVYLPRELFDELVCKQIMGWWDAYRMDDSFDT